MKLYKTIISLALLCINAYVQGCSHRYLVDKQELEQHPRGNITAVLTSDASYTFSDYGRGHIVDDTLSVY